MATSCDDAVARRRCRAINDSVSRSIMMRSIAVSRRFTLAVWVACSVIALPGAPRNLLADDGNGLPSGLRVFYTGHSFHMFVPARVEQLVKAAGIQGHQLVGTQGIGGSRVIQHWELETEKNKARPALATGKVDVFTMAAHVAIPDEGIARFTELGLMHNPKLRLLVQASWFPFDVPDPEKRIRENGQRDAMRIEELQAAVDEWRTKLEAQVDELNRKYDRQALFIVPVGDAVVKLRALVVAGKYPGVKSQSELFRDPIGHVGPHAQALAAYCNYVAIYRVSPEGLKVTTDGTDETQHAILQKLAWETVSQYRYSGVEGRKR
jgi:hypothetical protein